MEFYGNPHVMILSSDMLFNCCSPKVSGHFTMVVAAFRKLGHPLQGESGDLVVDVDHGRFQHTSPPQNAQKCAKVEEYHGTISETYGKIREHLSKMEKNGN